MNKEDRIYLLDKCIDYYKQANRQKYDYPYVALTNYKIGQAIKEIIEEKIDCQAKEYYYKYMHIVELHNKF